MADTSLKPSAKQVATAGRYLVLGLVCALSMITYMDRACLGSAAKEFVHDLGLSSPADLNWVFVAFTLAYALCEIPSGWLGDVFGPRRVLIRIVLWWSAFTALTGLVGMSLGGRVFGAYRVGAIVVTPLMTLIVVRFLFGMGEAGAYPNITRALHNWFPLEERGFAQGAVWMCGRLMGGLTPLVWTLLLPVFAWRSVFWVFAAIGVLWCFVFAIFFRNTPDERDSQPTQHSERNTQHPPVPWSQLLTSGNLWIVCLMYACQSYGWAVYLTYLPSFFEDHYGLAANSTLGAIYKGGPLWMGAAGCLIGGLLTDWFVRRTGNRRLGRRLFGAFGHGMTVICFLICPLMPSAFWFFLAMSLSGFFTDLTMGSAWAVCQDIGRRYAAIVAGAMNMVGALGGMLANWATGYVVQRSVAGHAARLGLPMGSLSPAEKAAGELAGYHLNFVIFAAVFVVGTICWLRIDADQAVAEPNPHSAE